VLIGGTVENLTFTAFTNFHKLLLLSVVVITGEGIYCKHDNLVVNQWIVLEVCEVNEVL
jgi:hypothetical protein